MKSLFDLLPNLDKVNKEKLTSERQWIIREFVNAINIERLATKGKFKQVTGRQIAVQLGHLKNNQTLYFFLNQCKRYQKEKGSFGKCFFGSLKVR